MPYFRIIDPNGVNGHPERAVVEFPVYMGNALRVAGRVEPARAPSSPSADLENRVGGYQAPSVATEGASPQSDDDDDHPDEEPEPLADLEELTVVELKAELAARDLSRTGNKDELIKRLRAEGV